MKKVLIIDDSEEFNFLMMSLFKFHKYEVETVTSSQIGIEKSLETKFDVIIIDYMMEDGKTGLDILNEIVFDGAVNFKTPKILLTAKFLDEDEKDELLKYGVVYLSKPIMPNDLFRKITEMIG